MEKYVIHPAPGCSVNIPYVGRFSDIQEAREAALRLARQERVDVEVLTVTTVFLWSLTEEVVE